MSADYDRESLRGQSGRWWLTGRDGGVEFSRWGSQPSGGALMENLPDDSLERTKLIFDAYSEYARLLRTWLVAYGIGGPILFLNTKNVYERIHQSPIERFVVFTFLAGLLFQVAMALIYKWVTWFIWAARFRAELKGMRARRCRRCGHRCSVCGRHDCDDHRTYVMRTSGQGGREGHGRMAGAPRTDRGQRRPARGRFRKVRRRAALKIPSAAGRARSGHPPWRGP
jgi:hypothetical protein